jgi:selT/selW/selH-like putative selenoprotein
MAMMGRRTRRPSLKGTVTVEFWDGYADSFKELAAAIEAAYPHVQVLGNLDQPRKGAFEVTGHATGRVYHSAISTGRLPVPSDIVAALRDEYEFIEAPAPAQEPMTAALVPPSQP